MRVILLLMMFAASPAWATTFAANAPASDQERAEAIAVLHMGLADHCGDRHLEWLDGPNLFDAETEWAENLPADERRQFQSLAQPDADRCEAGADCPAMAYAIAASRMRRTDEMTQAICRDVKLSCTEPGVCQ